MLIRRIFVLALIALCFGRRAIGAASAPTIEVSALPSPAGGSAVSPSLASGPDGTVWLSWVEPTGMGTVEHRVNALRVAAFAAPKRTWGAPAQVVASQTVGLDQVDVPQLAIDGRGTIYAVWGDGSGGAYLSRSSDGGATWTTPAPWTHASADAANFALARLANGRVLAVWLDGRDHRSHRTALYSRLVDDPESAETIVADSVCDCCRTALAPLLDGGALLAYRGRTPDEIRDIQVDRWRDRQWDKPRTLNPDGWRLTGCPVNGPQLFSDGSRAMAAWFTAADGEARVLASYTPDAGTRWLMPIRIDRGRPAGHPDLVLLRDGAALVVWMELDGSVWLRRITPDFTATDPIALAPSGGAATHGIPRLALLEDYAGAKSTARLLVAFSQHRAGTQDTTAAGITTLLLSVPEGELVMAERNCDCAPTPDELRGFPIRGTVRSVDANHHTVRLQHPEVPGIFAAGSRDFRVSADDFSAFVPGKEFLARIERRQSEWWLFDPRRLAAPLP